MATRTGEHITVLAGEAAELLPALTARLLYPTAMQGYQDLSFNDQVLRRRAAIAEYRALVREKRKDLENSACAVLRQEFALP